MTRDWTLSDQADEAVQALRDVMAWRWAARGLSAAAMAPGGVA